MTFTTRLNVSTKSVALFGAALLLLDFSATAVVSAATATSYLAGEVSLPFPVYVGAAFVFVLFTVVSLSGLRESARVATGVLAMHVSSDVSYCLPTFDHMSEQGCGNDHAYRSFCHCLGQRWDGSVQI